jgi:hypothetical protein
MKVCSTYWASARYLFKDITKRGYPTDYRTCRTYLHFNCYGTILSRLLYTRMYCLRGGLVWGSGPQTDKTLPQSPVTGQLSFDDDILLCLLCVLSFSYPSAMIKKSSPGSPCLTTTSPSSKLTPSSASATVSRSHLSRFSINNK